MSNTFWAVFFGASLGLFTVNLATALIDEWRHKQHHKRLEELGQFLEDLEYDDDEED
jgi:hypothetical protein